MAKYNFKWDDPFLLEDQLSDEEKQFRDVAYEYAQQGLLHRITEFYENETTDVNIYREFGERGLIGVTIPKQYGGADANYVSYGLIAREMERVDSAFRTMLSVQSSLVMFPIYEFGSEAQKEKYLPPLARGERIGAFGLTEPEAGSDPAAMSTCAEKVEGGYRITGHKRWNTGTVADTFIIWAKSEAHENKIRGFILERDMDGLSTPKIEGKLSFRGVPSGEVVMQNVFVPEENLMPEGVGLKAPFECLNRARYGISWGVMGAAEACWHAAREYTMNRKQFNKPLASTQLIQKKLADMQTEIALGLQGSLRVGRLFDEHRYAPEMISIVKRNNCGKALDIARMARDMHGGNGILAEHNVMRHMINLETVNTYEGTHDIHALILGRAQTGIQAFF
ncbi:MAG: acyl-CoA dehydrogenase [Chloroflexota bacterium]